MSLIVVQQNWDQRGAVSLTVVQQNRGIEDHCGTKKQGPLGCSKTPCSTAEIGPRGTVRYVWYQQQNRTLYVGVHTVHWYSMYSI